MLIVHGEKRESKAELLAQARPFENISFCQVTDILCYPLVEFKPFILFNLLVRGETPCMEVENLFFCFKEYTCQNHRSM